MVKGFLLGVPLPEHAKSNVDMIRRGSSWLTCGPVVRHSDLRLPSTTNPHGRMKKRGHMKGASHWQVRALPRRQANTVKLWQGVLHLPHLLVVFSNRRISRMKFGHLAALPRPSRGPPAALSRPSRGPLAASQSRCLKLGASCCTRRVCAPSRYSGISFFCSKLCLKKLSTSASRIDFKLCMITLLA